MGAIPIFLQEILHRHIAQFRENLESKLCANCELTNCWGWGKMKNLLNLAEIEQLKKSIGNIAQK